MKFLIFNLKFLNKNQSQSGQIALIVLLISAVAMTIGLSVSHRTITETKISNGQELLKKAFNAAESGVDYYLGTGNTNYVSPDNKSNAQVVVNKIGQSNSLDSDGLVLDGNTSWFWLSGHSDDGSLDTNTIYSGTNVNICVDAGYSKALKIDYFYKDGVNYKVIRKGYNFDTTNSTVSGFNSRSDSPAVGCRGISLNLVAGTIPLLITVKPISGNTNISINGTSNFPLQGEEINSVGKAGDLTTSGVNMKVKVSNRYKIPSFLLEAITAGNSVTSE
jgi:Tfp pilus assembly protein PilX